jgi:hypothetical protein
MKILEQMGVLSVGGRAFYEAVDKAIGRQG